MRNFPPNVRGYLDPAAVTPDTRTPMAFLRWTFRYQGRLLVLLALVAVLWELPVVLTPWIFGRAIDHGIAAGRPSQAAGWIVALAIITVLGAALGILNHTLIVRSWLISLYGTTEFTSNKSLKLGHVMNRRMPTGEVLSVSTNDADLFGEFIEVSIRAASALIGYSIVAFIVLSTSWRLGLVVLIVAPLVVLVAAPLLGPMERSQALERSRNSTLTSMATDIVAGLRILRGVGGEDIFGRNYATQSRRVKTAGITAGAWQSLVDATGVVLSGIFIIALMYLGVTEVTTGRLSLGDLVAFLGYGLFMTSPIRTFFEWAQTFTRTRVAARRTSTVLSISDPWREPSEPVGSAVDGGHESGEGDLVDEHSGAVLERGKFTVVVSADPDESASLADRLARYLPPETDPTPTTEIPPDLKPAAARALARAQKRAQEAASSRDVALATGPWGVTLGGIDLAEIGIDELRAEIVLSDTASHVFAGTLQQAVDPHARLSRVQAERALFTAAAEDVYEAIPGGWQGELDERGRGLSGGQRQRLVLARALAQEPPILILVEPTSAVDAHTEDRIARHLPPFRAGRTTVVMSASPLLLHRADHIVFLDGGVVAAAGTHEQLLAGTSAYRSVVLRGEQG